MGQNTAAAEGDNSQQRKKNTVRQSSRGGRSWSVEKVIVVLQCYTVVIEDDNVV